MRKLRKCDSARLNTGVSKCPPDFGKMKGAIIVHHGHKLPAELDGESLEELCHADTPDRAYGVITFTEYAKNGGEMQVSDNGYGGPEATGVSNRTDTFTLDRYYPELYAALTRAKNAAWDVYFFDANNMIHGINDGTDTLAGFPMACIYADATPFPTSSEKASMTVSFAFKDSEEAITDYDYAPLGFNPLRFTLGLTEVQLVKAGENDYKLIEKVGGNDLTSAYGSLIAKESTSVLNGSASAASYEADKDVLTITTSGGAVPTLKAPSVLYQNGIKGIEGV